MADFIEQYRISRYVEEAFGDYADYVIKDRAIPDIRDGLKPVQRRLVHAMNELGLTENAKPKKSARTVGDVIGKYHPHGDSACYEAMVALAQNFGCRYPLVDGQGNWGSADDPKSFAAMRYTEARLTAMARTLTRELKSGTVDWIPNFDGAMKEPNVLPAQLPLGALNGAMGIAVGMATNIPTHNLREIADAACLVLKKGTIIDYPGMEVGSMAEVPLLRSAVSLDDVMQIVPAPDYPSGGQLVSTPQDVKEIYKTGRGSVKVRCRWTVEDGNKIVIHELPHQVASSKVIEQIADLVVGKRLNGVDDVQDESDRHAPIRITLTFRPRTMSAEAIMAIVCSKTDCEQSFRVNWRMIGLDGNPHQFGLLEYLESWASWRVHTTRRRLLHRIGDIEARLHVLSALIQTHVHIDTIIHMIRTEDEPKSALMARFNLDDIQAEAILNIKLRALAKLEYLKLEQERDALTEELNGLTTIISDESQMRGLVVDEITDAARELSDDRRTQIGAEILPDAGEIEAKIESEPVTVVLSTAGFIRSVRGHVSPESHTFRPGDGLLTYAHTMSIGTVTLLDDMGRIYPVKVEDVPGGRTQGKPISAFVNLQESAKPLMFLSLKEDDELFLSADNGRGFFVPAGDLVVRQKGGKPVMVLKDGAKMLPPIIRHAGEGTHIACLSDTKKVVIFPLDLVNRYPRSQGVVLQKVEKTMREVDIVTFAEDRETVEIFGKKMTKTKLEPYLKGRGTKGSLWK